MLENVREPSTQPTASAAPVQVKLFFYDSFQFSFRIVKEKLKNLAKFEVSCLSVLASQYTGTVLCVRSYVTHIFGVWIEVNRSLLFSEVYSFSALIFLSFTSKLKIMKQN